MKSLLEQKLYIPVLILLIAFIAVLWQLRFDVHIPSDVTSDAALQQIAVATCLLSLLGSAIVYYWMKVRKYPSSPLYAIIYLSDIVFAAVISIQGDLAAMGILWAIISIAITLLNLKYGLQRQGLHVDDPQTRMPSGK